LSELSRRVLFGVPAAILFVYIIWLGGIVLNIVTSIIALMVLIEMARLFRNMNFDVDIPVAIVLGLFIWTIAYQPGWMSISFSIVILIITIWSLLSRGNKFSGRWIATLFCGLYAPVGFYFFNEVRMIQPDDAGFWLTLALILMIWGNDMFAYFGGRSFGKRPLAPKISPNKTWEGFWSGFAGALAGLMIAYLISDSFPVSLSYAIPMVVLVSIFGPSGDLLESRLKRIAGVKDSSDLLPGHGGFFDRFDALILTTPVIYLYLLLIYL
jgi:phosphatidate cytidylyltransferase